MMLILVITALLLKFCRSNVLIATRDGYIEMSNEYIVLHFNIVHNSIDYISSDFHGTRNFTHNILAQPFQLSVLHATNISSKNDGKDDKYDFNNVKGNNYQWLMKTEQEASLKIIGIVDNPVDPIVMEDWVISLIDHQRSFTVAINGIDPSEHFIIDK